MVGKARRRSASAAGSERCVEDVECRSWKRPLSLTIFYSICPTKEASVPSNPDRPPKLLNSNIIDRDGVGLQPG